MPGGYGTDESLPWGSSGDSYVTPGQTSSPYVSGAGPTNNPGNNGSNNNNNNNNNPWSGNDWADEFADTGITVDYDAYAGSYNPNNVIDYGGVDPEYQAYLDNLVRHTNDQGFSWYTTPGQSWTDRRDQQLISAFGGILNPGDPDYWDPLAGLSEEDKTKMWLEGEFPWPLGGSGTTGGGPGPGGGGWGGGRGGGGGGGRGGGMGGGTPRFQGDFAGENPWGQSQIQRAWINQLRGMNRGGIVSLC